MMKAKYNDKIVEAIRYNGFNKDDIKELIQKTVPSEVYTTQDNSLIAITEYTDLVIPQYEYVVREENGRIYLCNPEEFEEKYETIFEEEYTWDASLFEYEFVDINLYDN